MKSATLFGASGELAQAIAVELLAQGWHVDAVCRASRVEIVSLAFETQIEARQLRLHCVQDRYVEFEFVRNSNAVFLTQALFEPTPLASMSSQAIADEVTVGLTDPLALAGKFLQAYPSVAGMRRDICFVGSTSAYAGFRNTTVYCAVKHGLLGFVRALNDEYASTDDRFWLFSMGTMRTAMGAKVQGQDVSTYLDPQDVARRMVVTLLSPTNLFEPEVIIRRRTIKLL